MNGDIYLFEEGVDKRQCLNCGSIDSEFDAIEKFYECNVCQHVWAYDDDDPDYRELETCPNCNGYGYVENAFSHDPHCTTNICSFCDSAGVL